VSFEPAIRALVEDLKRGPVGRAARKFHNTLARAILETAQRAEGQHGIRTVVLAGGVFLNRVLLDEAVRLLKEGGFRVLRPRKYSPCDESISLGQIAYGLAWLKNKKNKGRA
jgi:hydrogenase maturation protein HypF